MSVLCPLGRPLAAGARRALVTAAGAAALAACEPSSPIEALHVRAAPVTAVVQAGTIVPVIITVSNPTNRTIEIWGNSCALDFRVMNAAGHEILGDYICLDLMQQFRVPAHGSIQDTAYFGTRAASPDGNHANARPLPPGRYRMVGVIDGTDSDRSSRHVVVRGSSTPFTIVEP